MRIAVIYAGPFGEQIINTISTGGFGDDIAIAYELRPEQIQAANPGNPAVLQELWEDPDAYVPGDLVPGESDLLLVLGIHSRLSVLVPSMARRLSVRAVLYAVDDRDTMPDARKTIEDELRESGIAVEFSEPLCLLDRSVSPEIETFARRFGRPAFRVTVTGGVITGIEVLRDTPCGSASSIAGRLLGTSIDDATALARRCHEEHHNENAGNYCLAGMDPLCPLMQEASDLVKDAVFSACGLPATKDLMRSRTLESGGIPEDTLRKELVDAQARWAGGTVGCITDRAFDLYRDELISEGAVCRGADGMLVPCQRHDGD